MNKEFNKGLLLAGFGSFWWGFFGVIYFKYIAYIGHIELVVHRCLWTTCSFTATAPGGREVRVTWSACASAG